MSYYSNHKQFLSKLLLLLFAMIITACGPIAVEPEVARQHIKTLEPEEFWNESEDKLEKYVDFPDTQISACEWQKKLERSYSSGNGRFRLLGGVGLRKPVPPADEGGPFSIITALISVVDFFMPWNWFGGVKNPPMEVVPWGRVDMKGFTLHSIALLEGADGALPNREEFLQKVDEALKKSNEHFKLLAFKLGIATGMIDPLEKRDEVVQAEIEKVFPGLFGHKSSGDMTESFAWVMMRNGIRKQTNISIDDLRVYARPLPVFRDNSWESLADDMKRGLGAAVANLYSSNSRERACASNIIFRSTDQLIHLMGGVTTLPVYDSDSQSYVPSIKSIVSGQDKPVLNKCHAAGSMVRKKMRVVVTEKSLLNMPELKNTYSWAPEPKAMRSCRPDGDGWASGYSSESSKGLNSLMFRLEAFGHYLFAFNPNAKWWLKSGRFPMGKFEGLATIQDTGAIAPFKTHLLALGLMQLDFEHFLDRHLVFLSENNHRTFDQDKAVAIRLATQEVNDDSTLAETKLSEVLKLLQLLSKFDRYLVHLEHWKTSSHYSNSKMKALFGTQKSFNKILGLGDELNSREKIHKFYLASSLLLLKYINTNDLNECYSSLTTDLSNGHERVSGSCDSQQTELAQAFEFLSSKLDSALLLRYANALKAP